MKKYLMLAKILRQFCYLLEFFTTIIVLKFFYLLPFKWASATGGTITALIGPKLSVSKIAHRNLSRVFPDMMPERREQIIKGMWKNLGRTIAEYNHISRLDIWQCDHVEIINAHIIDTMRDDQKPGLLFLGHIANWEYATLPAIQKGLEITQLYRTLNNPYVAKIIDKVHGKIVHDVVTKGAQGAKKMLAVLKQGGHISMLIDQKLNEGMAVPFLGIDAMTPTALAKLALKFNCPIIPIQVERISGINCRVTYHPPVPIPITGTQDEKVFNIMLAVNNILSNWIRTRPEDWIWMHNRWPKINN